MTFFAYLLQEYRQILFLLFEHIQLTLTAVGIAVLLGIPLGILVNYVKSLHKIIMGTVNVVQAIPSMALLGAVIPLLGIGKVPAIVVVALYSLLPIVKNTYTGIRSAPPELLEAAQGIGLTKFQVLSKVQFPLALPVIMAGVRISAVSAVGLVTIAAFIGAGGLGFLVFSGISTVNSNLILAGAIPACLLALFVDYIGGVVEKRISPDNLRLKQQPRSASWFSARRRLVYASMALLVCLAGGAVFLAYSGEDEDVIIIGGKDFSEQYLLPHMLAELIENKTDIKVDRKINLGGTQVCFAALRSGDIDMYVDYSGTAYGDTLGYPPITDMEKVYQVVKKDFHEKFSVLVLPQMMFNNTYTIATSPEIAARNNLKKISDLVGVAENFSSAMTFEFLNREDGLPGLSKRYGFAFKASHAMNSAQRYIALENGNVQFIDAFSTDGLLKKYNLITLQDDKAFFPPYYAIPLIREETAARYPEILPLVESLGRVLTNDIMIELNYRVDELQQDPRTVARAFLLEKSLIED